MDSQLQTLLQLINNITGIVQNDSIRKQSEEQIKQFCEQNPDNFILCCIHLLQQQTSSEDVKKFVASQLRKNLSQFSERTYNNCWKLLTPETQTIVKQKLLVCLEYEQSKSIRKLICDAVGEIGGGLMQSDENQSNQWPELVGIVWQLFQQEQEMYQESGFHILQNLLCFATEVYDKFQNEVYTLLSHGLVSQSPRIKLAAIQTFGAYIEVLEQKQCKKYENLVNQLYEGVYVLMSLDEKMGEDALSVLGDIAESDPKFLKKSFDQLFNLVVKIFQIQSLSQGTKKIGTELLLQLIDRLNDILKNKRELIGQLLDMIFYHMIDIDEEIDDDWKIPPEGFSEDIEDDADFETTRFGMGAIDRIIGSIGEKEMLPIVSEKVQTLLQHQDWRYKFAALMALSQLGEYIEEVEQAKPIIKVILTFFDNENCKIRYAVCHAIGQIADDMKPAFQESFMQDITPLMLQKCDDPIPRVASHALAAITNLVESVNKDLLKQFLDQILNKSFFMLNNGISIIKENAVSAIAATAESAKEYFNPYFEGAMNVLFTIYNQYSSTNYKQLRGQTIECITLIGHGVSKELFTPYLPQVIDLFITLQESKLEQVDPQKAYVLSGYQRICLIFADEMVPYLTRIIPSLFRLVKEVFLINENPELTSVKTYDQDEADIAINMLEVFIDKIGKNFLPFIDECTQIIVPLCQYQQSDEIKTSAQNCLPSLVKCVIDDQNMCNKIVKYFLEVLLQASKSEYETDIIINLISNMKEIVKLVKNFYNEYELNEFSQKIFDILMESDKRKAQFYPNPNLYQLQFRANEKIKEDESIDEDEKDQIDEDNQQEEDLHVSIAELIGSLFMTHKEICITLSNTIYTTILPKVLQENLSDKIHKFGIFIIVDMVEHLGYMICADKWVYLAEALVKFSSHKSISVRQAAVYGLGKFAEQTPVDNFSTYSQHFLSTINAAYMIPGPQGKEKIVGCFRDNCMSSLGKIMKYQGKHINMNEVINYWLLQLPLKYDKKEACEMHELLVDVAINNPLILFTNEANVSKVILIYGQIIDTKHCNLVIQNKIIISLRQLINEEFVKNNWNVLMTSLNEIQRKKIEKIVADIQAKIQ